jgi:hypothetical protein
MNVVSENENHGPVLPQPGMAVAAPIAAPIAAPLPVAAPMAAPVGRVPLIPSSSAAGVGFVAAPTALRVANAPENEGPVLPQGMRMNQLVAQGLRRRGPGAAAARAATAPALQVVAQPQPQPPSHTQEQLLALIGPAPQGLQEVPAAQNATRDVQAIALQALELARETNTMVRASLEAQHDAGAALERIEGTTAGLAYGQSTLITIGRRVNAGVKGLVKTSDAILGITQRTEKMVKTMRSSGAAGVIAELLMDEWLVFYLYFLLHPLAPVSTEACIAVWKYALIINRGLNLRKDFKEGKLFVASPSGMINIYFTSPWKAIFLLHWYNMKFQGMHGSPQYADLFPGGLDAAFGAMGSTFISFFTQLRQGDVIGLASMAGHGMSLTGSAIYDGVSAFFERFPDALKVVNDACPTFAQNKTVFFNCITEYVLGRGQIVVDGITHHLAAPGYIFQAGAYFDMETNVIFWVGSMIWKYTKILFGKLLDYLYAGFAMMVCNMKIPATTWTPEFSLGKFMGYDCKFKKEGGGHTYTRDLLDTALAFSSFSLFMAYSMKPITKGRLHIPRAAIHNLEGIVYALIRLESSKKIMGNHPLLLHGYTRVEPEKILSIKTLTIPDIRRKKSLTRRRRRTI